MPKVGMLHLVMKDMRRATRGKACKDLLEGGYTCVGFSGVVQNVLSVLNIEHDNFDVRGVIGREPTLYVSSPTSYVMNGIEEAELGRDDVENHTYNVEAKSSTFKKPYNLIQIKDLLGINYTH
ncbi:hypothetical protein PIB30_050604 [Stylosanthes scabra]|uniref:Uncharacterized protein n=1 Tax=Stylosanthes scabra TaxID=79078 RepID=A0ABU6XHX8_9FABA|nr:hypothetical protein [Stylosanthes scabra]